jgi:hypothetical protein
MLSQPLPESAANPFATRFIQPGAVPFLFPPDENVASLVRRLENQRWRGQIVGCHGSGKTSLLVALKAHLEQRIPVFWYRVDPQHKLPGDWYPGQSTIWRRNTLVVIDGFGQLSFWRQCWVRILAEWRRCGLLVTTHRRLWTLPVLVELRPTESTFRAVVEHVLQNGPVPVKLDDALLGSVWQQYGPNMREALFCLYEHVRQSVGARPASDCLADADQQSNPPRNNCL